MIGKIKSKIASKVGGSLSRIIFKNSSLNAFRTILLAGLSFVTIPIILHKLGAENYGVWALVVAFGSYSNFLELGFNSAVTKLVASSGSVGISHEESLQNENNVVTGHCPVTTNKDIKNPTGNIISNVITGQCPVTTDTNNINDNIADQINSTVITYILVSVIIFLFVLLFYPVFKNLMFKNVNAPFLDLFILGTLALNLMNLTTSNYFSVLTGRMRMDLTNLIMIFSNLVQTGLTIVLLFQGQGLTAVFVGSAFGGVINSVFPVFFAKREFPELFLSFKKYNFSKIKHLFKFSLKMYFINSVSNFLAATNKFIIVRLTGLDFVAYYEIANKVVLQLRILFQNILEPVYPAAAMVVKESAESTNLRINELARRGKNDENTNWNVVTGQWPVATENVNLQDKITRAYNKAFKYLFIISFLGYGAMVLLSYPVFLLWLGQKFLQVVPVTIIIGIGNFFNLQTAIPFFFLASLNRLQKPLMSALLVLICNFVFGLMGFWVFGFYGLIAGFSFALILPSLWFIRAGKKEVFRER